MSLPLILSSSSITRRRLLERLQIAFTWLDPNIDETPLPAEQAPALVARLAKTKAEVTQAKHPAALIIGCDEVALLNGEIYGKPGNYEQAFQQLSQASGNSMLFYTGLCLLNSQTQHCQQHIATYEVAFRKLTPTMIDRYLQHEQPYHCAGSIMAEGYATTLFRYLKGDDFSALLGLPLIALCNMLNEENVALP